MTDRGAIKRGFTTHENIPKYKAEYSGHLQSPDWQPILRVAWSPVIMVIHDTHCFQWGQISLNKLLTQHSLTHKQGGFTIHKPMLVEIML